MRALMLAAGFVTVFAGAASAAPAYHRHAMAYRSHMQASNSVNSKGFSRKWQGGYGGWYSDFSRRKPL